MTKKLETIYTTCPGCGKGFETNQSKLDRGRGRFCSKSCSAQINSSKHGHTTKDTASRTYLTWVNMVRRCTKPKAARYKDYGAKGVTVDPSWMDFSVFLADMGPRPDGKTLDRKNGKLGYLKDNCRWSTPTEQANNLKSNRIVRYQGLDYTLPNLARNLSLKPMTLLYRIEAGWAEDKWSSPATYGDRSRNQSLQTQ